MSHLHVSKSRRPYTVFCKGIIPRINLSLITFHSFPIAAPTIWNSVLPPFTRRKPRIHSERILKPTCFNVHYQPVAACDFGS